MSAMSASAVLCFTYIVEKLKFQTIDCSKQILHLLTAVCISKRNHWTIGKSKVLCVFLGLGWIRRKNVKFESFCILDLYKRSGCPTREKDKCYAQITNLRPKFQVDRRSSPLAGRISNASAVTCFTYIVEKLKFQTIDCSKQIPDLLTAVKNIRGNHWTIGKSNVLCVFLGFGLDLEKTC